MLKIGTVDPLVGPGSALSQARLGRDVLGPRRRTRGKRGGDGSEPALRLEDVTGYERYRYIYIYIDIDIYI